MASAWIEFWTAAGDKLSISPFPCSQEWFAGLRRDGTLKRLSNGKVALAEDLLETAAGLLRLLPLQEEQPLAHTAARYCGSSHALDPTSPLSTLTLRGLALRQNQAMPLKTSERRRLWAEFGVVSDSLSAPVLTFNLGITGQAALADLLATAASAVQPIHLATHLLWATSWEELQYPKRVFVCENPTVVALAVARLGKTCPPLVCVDGEPKTSARLLLKALVSGGASLFYHGDFDWPGLAIAERVFREFGASPWHFDARSYQEAIKHQGRPLVGKAIPTPWSPDLSKLMEEKGAAYDEELLADEMFGDLAQ